MTEFDADLRHLLGLLVRLALAPDAPGAAGWRTEAAAARAALASGADRPAPKLDGLWTLAVRDAEADPAVKVEETVNPALPVACPFGWPALAAADFDLEGAATVLRTSASTG